MRKLSMAILGVLALAPVVFLSINAPAAQARLPVPDAPYISMIDNSCVDNSTMLYFIVLRYDAVTQQWDGAEGVHTVTIQGRGGSIRHEHWSDITTAETEQFGGGGYYRWSGGEPLPYTFRLRLPDGTLSPTVPQPEGCTSA